MIEKILFKKQSKVQLYIAILGTFIGFIFLTTSVHFFIRINESKKNEDVLKGKAIVIQKKVSSLSTLNLVKTDFKPDEIEKLNSQDFTLEVQPIINNSFDISIQTDSKLLPYFRSDIFLQAVDARFLDVSSIKWQWDENDAYVPIILPREFLVMLNTFANARGLPQVSEELAKSVSFQFNLSGNAQKTSKKVKIIGFTGDISSILVPPSFLNYGNEKFGNHKSLKTTQLLVSIHEGTFGKLEKHMQSHGLEAKESSLVIGKLISITSSLLLFSMGISVLIIVLSSLLLIQYTQVLIAHNRYEIRTLLRIGYSPQKITKTITKYFVNAIAFTASSSYLAFVFVKITIDKKLLESGLSLSKTYTFQSGLALLFVVSIYLILNHLNTKSEILNSDESRI